MCSLNQVQHDITDQLELQLKIIFIINYQLLNVKKVLITVISLLLKSNSPKQKNSLFTDEEKLQIVTFKKLEPN